MGYNTIKTFRLIKSNREIWCEFNKQKQFISLQRKASLFEAIGQNDLIIYVRSGIIGSFLNRKNDKEKEKCVNIYGSDNFITTLGFLKNQYHKNQKLLALSDIEIEYITLMDYEKAINKNEQLANFGRMINEVVYANLKRKLLSQYIQTPTEQYKELKKSFPIQLEQIPKKYISSYIGITPASYSRLLKEETI